MNDFSASHSLFITNTKFEGPSVQVALGHPRPEVSDQLCGRVIWPSVVCFGHSGEERGWAVIWSPPDKLDLLAEEEARKTLKAQTCCEGLLGTSGGTFWRSSTPTSRRTLTRSREAGDIESEWPVVSTSFVDTAVAIDSPVPVVVIPKPGHGRQK